MLESLDHGTLSKDAYREQLNELQMALMTLQHGLYQQNKRCVIVLEGTDAAGKGGLIRRFTTNMDPRGYHVHPIGAPTPEELSQHYLQRFWSRLPKAGKTAIFDRSWYGRVLVERVEELVPSATWQRTYEEIRQFEQLLVDDDIILIKLFLHIDQDEQLRRFKERLEQPHKRWKLTPEDITARLRWDEYQQAFEDMLAHSRTSIGPWYIVGANQKRFARIEAMQHIRNSLSQAIDIEHVDLLDPEVERLAKLHL